MQKGGFVNRETGCEHGPDRVGPLPEGAAVARFPQRLWGRTSETNGQRGTIRKQDRGGKWGKPSG